jgi:hypothetical protein
MGSVSQSVIPGSGTVGYKLHTAANTGSQADIQDSQCINALAITSPLPQGVHYMAADCGYDDDHKLYDLSITRGFELLCSVS